MDKHYHRCGECGLVWGHQDRDWAEAPEGEFKAAHSCPKGCPGKWTEIYEPKKITKEELDDLGACTRGINTLFEMVGEGDCVVVSFETIELIQNDFLEEAASWTYDLLRRKKLEDEFIERRRHMNHTDEPRCSGCVNRLMLFVELYNRG